MPPRHGVLPPDHVPDLLAENLKVVFCGTALGRISAERRAYYAHPGNRFWRALHETGLTPARLRPEEWPTLLNLGIGLTDVCKTHFGNDAALPRGAFDAQALRERIARFNPRMIAFTSKAAAAAALGRPTAKLPYGVLEENFSGAAVAVLPSPSGAASGHWDIAVWHAVAAAVGGSTIATRIDEPPVDASRSGSL